MLAKSDKAGPVQQHAHQLRRTVDGTLSSASPWYPLMRDEYVASHPLLIISVKRGSKFQSNYTGRAGMVRAKRESEAESVGSVESLDETTAGIFETLASV